MMETINSRALKFIGSCHQFAFAVYPPESLISIPRRLVGICSAQSNARLRSRTAGTDIIGTHIEAFPLNSLQSFFIHRTAVFLLP